MFLSTIAESPLLAPQNFLYAMAPSLNMPPELWRDILDQFWGMTDPNELRALWNNTRLVSRQFKVDIERLFEVEHLPNTQLVLAICE